MTMTIEETGTTEQAPRSPASRRKRSGPASSMSPARRTFIWAARIILIVGFVSLWEIAGRREWVDTSSTASRAASGTR